MPRQLKAIKSRRGRPLTGKAVSAAERMRRMRSRRKAAGFKTVTSWAPRTASSPTYSSHRLLEARSLAMHAVIAHKINGDRALLAIPRHNLKRWRKRWSDDPPPAWFEEWRQIMSQPWNEVAAIITEPSENAARLRQSSPFAGVLTTEERNRIYEAFRA